tara:strand:+ start:396 stop:542 length:147 start_codon:yes stop_codon:yes gene_type:complete
MVFSPASSHSRPKVQAHEVIIVEEARHKLRKMKNKAVVTRSQLSAKEM